MVAPALCIPCMTGLAAATGPAAPVVLGASAIGAAGYYSLKKSKKKKKSYKKKKKKIKTNKKKKNKTKQRGAGVSLKKNMKNINNKYSKCRKKCPELTTSVNNLNELSSKEKKEWNKKRVTRNRCWSECEKIKQNDIKLHKKNYSKEYRVINKDNKKNCCRCHYVKSGSSLRKVRGNWGHCSYDMQNCCKDKKTIIKPKN